MSAQHEQEEEEGKDEENRDDHHVLSFSLGTFEFVLTVWTTEFSFHSYGRGADDAMPVARDRNLLRLLEVL